MVLVLGILEAPESTEFPQFQKAMSAMLPCSRGCSIIALTWGLTQANLSSLSWPSIWTSRNAVASCTSPELWVYGVLRVASLHYSLEGVLQGTRGAPGAGDFRLGEGKCSFLEKCHVVVHNEGVQSALQALY